MALTPEEQEELTRLQQQFDALGGRSVEIADRIDALREKETEGVQYLLLKVVTPEDAEPPAEWDWSDLADMHRPDAITVEWAGPFTDHL